MRIGTLEKRMVREVLKRNAYHELYDIVKDCPSTISYIPDQYKTKEMWEYAVNMCSSYLCDVPDNLITQEMCDNAVLRCSDSLEFVPKKYKTEQMCKAAVENS